MDKISRIQIEEVYLGVLDLDDDDETQTPVIVAVSSESLPFAVKESGDDSEAPLSFEIEKVSFIRNKSKKLSGKALVTFIPAGFSEGIASDEDSTDANKIPNDVTAELDEKEVKNFGNFTDEELEEFTEQVDELKETIMSQLETSEKASIFEGASLESVEAQIVDSERYEILMDNTFILTMLGLHLTGQPYIVLFDKESKPKRKNAVISLNDIQALVEFPDSTSEEFQDILRSVAEVASERGMQAVHQLAPGDPQEEELFKKSRAELFLILSEFLEGSTDALEKLKAISSKINDFERRVIDLNHDYQDGDDETETMMSLIERILFTSTPKSILPRAMEAKEALQFRSDFVEFESIMEQFSDDESFGAAVGSLSDEMSLNDSTVLNAPNIDTTAALAYVCSPIKKSSLPANLFLMGEDLDFGGLYNNNWNLVDSSESLRDSEGNMEHDLGSSLVAALIAAAIRIVRFAEMTKVDTIVSLSRIMNTVAPEDNYWQLGAFSHSLAVGKTDMFKKMMSATSSDAPLSTVLHTSLLGVTMCAFAIRVQEEKWSDDSLSMALRQSPVIAGFVEEARRTSTELFEKFLESDEAESCSSEEKDIVKHRSFIQAIGNTLMSLSEDETSVDALSTQLTDAVLVLADLNTGKQTSSSVDSTEWIDTKTKYLTSFLKDNNHVIFE